MVLGVTSTVAVPEADAVTALVAPGTGTPDANVIAGYLENARDYYMTTTPCTVENDCDVVGINYPASFWPLFFRPRWCVPGRCEKWDVSVADGLNNFNSALTNLLATQPDEEIVLFGYSQGGAIVSDQLRLIQDLDPALKERLSVVLIGNIDNPVGGPWSLLGFLGTIPIVDVTTGMPTIVDTGIPTTSVHFEYDGVGDFPIYWGNLPAFVNAVAGFWYVHGQMLWPNGYNETGLPSGYTPAELADQMDPALHPENFRYDSYGNPFITIPTRTLPIMIPFLNFGRDFGLSWLIEPLVDLVSPALRVIIDTAYDRTLNPGIPQYLSLLPFNPKLNLFDVAGDFFQAIGEGVEAFLGHFEAAAPPASGISGVPTERPAVRRPSAAVRETPVIDLAADPASAVENPTIDTPSTAAEDQAPKRPRATRTASAAAAADGTAERGTRGARPTAGRAARPAAGTADDGNSDRSSRTAAARRAVAGANA